MKNALQVNRVDFREISIPEGIKAVSKVIEDKSRILPLLESHNFLEKILKTKWVDSNLQSDARESLKGVLNSIENNLSKQAELHSKDLVSTYNYNTSLLTTKILNEHNFPAKIFSLIEKPNKIMDVEGQGFTWRLHPISESEEIVPSRFLERLTILKYNNIIPDSMYVGVPFGVHKPSLGSIVKRDLDRSRDTLLNAVSSGSQVLGTIREIGAELKQLPDPLLICGFGSSPLFLVQIGKWL